MTSPRPMPQCKCATGDRRELLHEVMAVSGVAGAQPGWNKQKGVTPSLGDIFRLAIAPLYHMDPYVLIISPHLIDPSSQVPPARR